MSRLTKFAFLLSVELLICILISVKTETISKGPSRFDYINLFSCIRKRLFLFIRIQRIKLNGQVGTLVRKFMCFLEWTIIIYMYMQCAKCKLWNDRDLTCQNFSSWLFVFMAFTDLKYFFFYFWNGLYQQRFNFFPGLFKVISKKYGNVLMATSSLYWNIRT